MEEEVIFRIEVPGAEKAVTSLESLTKANKALREERKKLDLSTAQGQERVKAINAELDKNTEAIKQNSSTLEKQRLNVGNYSGALDKLVPGLGATAEGFGTMTKSALTFIATPIGAVIGAIGLALAALMSYFKGSEKGQNDLNKVVAVGSALFEQLMNVVEAVGEVIFNAISNPKQAIIDFAKLIKENIINRFEGILELIPALGKSIGLLFKGEFSEAGKVAFDAVSKVTTGVENLSDKIAAIAAQTAAMVKEGFENGQKLAEFQASIDRRERALIVERARVSLEVSKLRAEAIEQEGEQRKETISEAIRLETELSDKEVRLAKIRLANAELLAKANGEDKAALEAVAKAQADLLAAEELRYSSTLRFQKELEKLREEDLKKQADEREAELARDAEEDEKRKEKFNKLEVQLNKNIEAQTKAREKKAKDDAAKDKKELDEKKKSFESLNKLVKDQTVAGKALAIGTATVNTYQGATEILKQKSTLPSPFDFITKAINFAATIASGLGAVKAISGVGFARGGLTGTRIMPHHGVSISRSNGDNLLTTVKTGEVILNQDQQNRLGGNRTFSRLGVPGFATGGSTGYIPSISTSSIARASESASTQREIFDAISKLTIVATVEDINAGQNRVQIVEDRATIFS
jgi:hypothetical protein